MDTRRPWKRQRPEIEGPWLPPLLVALMGLPITGCTALYLQDDGFRQELAKGCGSERECAGLVERAAERQSQCEPNTIGRVRCDQASADLDRARAMLEPLRAARVQKERLAHENEQQEQREEEARAYTAMREQKRVEGGQEQQRQNAEMQARYAEERRAREEDERKVVQRDAQLREYARDAAYAGPVLSAMICVEREALRRSQRDFAEQERIDRLSHTVRPEDRRDSVELTESYKADIRRHETRLRQLHAPARPCGEESAAIFRCVGLEAERGTYADTGGSGARDFDRKPLNARCDEPLGTYAEMIHKRVMDE